MKKMTRIVTLALALVLMLSLAAPALAADVVNETTHAYKAYQIFSGTQDTGSVELGNVQWGEGVDGAALMAELKTMDHYIDVTSAADVANLITSVTLAREFANIAVKYIKGNGTAIAADATTIDLAAGYYLLVDQTDVTGGEDAKNAALLQVTNAGQVYITKKYDLPTQDKNILGTDDQGHENHTKAEDYAIGDMVEFHLKAELPGNLEDYNRYPVVFHDAMSAGLDFDLTTADLEVVLSYTLEGETTAQVVTVDPQYYEVTVGDCEADLGKTCTFHVTFPDIKEIPGMIDGAALIVSYKAKLDDDALIDQGNPNDFRLEFANDPDYDYPEIPDLPDGDNPPPTGILPWVEVEVYTTGVTLKKVDGQTYKALTGAEFQITGAVLNRVKVTQAEFVLYAAEELIDAANRYWLLTDGTYTDTVPSAEVDLTKYVNVDEVYKRVETAEFMSVAENVDIKAFVGEDGLLKLEGLKEGKYTIKETTTPNGYNSIQDITLEVKFDETNKTYSYAWGGGVQGTGNSVTIENYKGAALPETGGIGTTLFYVFGGIMVAGAAILLVTKKRMSTI